MDKKILETVINILKTTDEGAILVFVKSGPDGNKLCDKLRQECKTMVPQLYPFCTELSAKSSTEKHPVSGHTKKKLC